MHKFFSSFGLRISAVCAVVLGAGLLHPPAVSAQGDIVLYASDATLISGAWTRASSSSGAGGQKMTTADAGWSSTSAAQPAPAHFFDVRFDAPAGTTYQIWLRLRAAADSKWNDSVWVQFDDAVDAGGSPLWRTGSSSALLINLEDCVGCGVSGWGWQDNASWTGQVARVRFAAAGTHTLRVQLREDGVDVDQIVLSPASWFSSPPGAPRDDATIVPKPGAGPQLSFVRQPYLQQVTAAGAVVVWATREGGPASVQYQRAGGTGATAAATSRLVPASITGLGYDYYQHEAVLSGLTAAATYRYQTQVGGIASGTTDSFTTAPPAGAGVARFIAFGDSGVGSTPQRQLAAAMTADTFDFALHTGDVAYGVPGGTGAGGYPQLQAWFFDIYRDWLRSRPVFPSIGNHDNEAAAAAPYRDVFVLPANGGNVPFPDHAERYYSFDYGPAHVVVLDTELAFQDPVRRQEQLSWLTDDLARTPQPWKIAVFHRSPYSAGGEHGSDLQVRAELAPIFESYGVALVLSGHEHDYERTVPWRESSGGSPVTYVVTGGGGAPLYPAGVAPFTAFSRSAHHYLRGTVSTCTIDLEAVGLDGGVFDSARLDRCATPPPAATPFGGTPARVPGIVEAENFDEGGPGIAYRDTTAGNSGAQYRGTDVDIEASTDAGGGFNVGWMAAGDWLAYTIDVTESGSFTIDARVASRGAGGTFHLEVDGVDVSGALTIPETGGWQNWQWISKAGVSLAAGRRTLRIVVDANGPGGVFGNINYLKVAAPAQPPAAAPEIVLYAADITTMAGSWSRVGDASAAAGAKLTTPDNGWASTSAPLASPADYFEVTFDAPAGTPYRLWLRLQATGDTKSSESVWVQFSDARSSSGAAVYGLGTTQGLLVNLENCSACGVSGWGWQNRAYWLADTGELRFASGGSHTMRVQVREDGVQLDQIVLSPSEFLAASPGGLKNDTRIVAKP